MGPATFGLILPVMGQKAKCTIWICWEPGPCALIRHQLILGLAWISLESQQGMYVLFFKCIAPRISNGSELTNENILKRVNSGLHVHVYLYYCWTYAHRQEQVHTHTWIYTLRLYYPDWCVVHDIFHAESVFQLCGGYCYPLRLCYTSYKSLSATLWHETLKLHLSDFFCFFVSGPFLKKNPHRSWFYVIVGYAYMKKKVLVSQYFVHFTGISIFKCYI